nr:hypothetical protein [Orenia metallireducens]
MSNKSKRLALIAGEGYDIIMILYKILKRVINRIEKLYLRAVKAQGNLKAIATIHNIFEIDERNWHGLGQIQRSGLKLKKGYGSFAIKKELEIKRRHQK